MNRIQLAFAIPALLCTSLFGQSDTAAPIASENTPAPVIYVVGGDVSAPQLISVDAKLVPAESCKSKYQGHVALQFVLDKAGIPRNIGFVKSDEFALNFLANQILASERFHPAKRNGEAVPVSFLAVLTLSGCDVESADGSGKKAVHLVEKPGQKLAPLPLDPEDAKWALAYFDPKDAIEGGVQIERVVGASKVSPPAALNQVEAEFSPEARSEHKGGIVLVTLIVDPAGLPRNLRILRPCGYGLDEEALKAVHKYKFTPAKEHGQAVPVQITVEVNFQST